MELVRLPEAAPMTRPPPKFLFTTINTECNLRCQHCYYWTTKEPPPESKMSIDRVCDVIDEFADLSPRGSVVICGGEPMLARDSYFRACAACRALGLRSLSVTNGTTINNMDEARHVLSEGPDEITVSLDSHLESVHDSSRGTRGAFQAAVRALRLLVSARSSDRSLAFRRIFAMALIYDDSSRDLDSLYHLVLRDVGADKLKINMLQPSFGLGTFDHFFVKHHSVDGADLARQLRECDQKYSLRLSPVWIEQVESYCDSLMRGSFENAVDWYYKIATSEHVCNSGERNVMVDLRGTARLCFSDRFRGEKLERRGDLRSFWLGADDVRREMNKCYALCGISHSVRRESATLKEIS